MTTLRNNHGTHLPPESTTPRQPHDRDIERMGVLIGIVLMTRHLLSAPGPSVPPRDETVGPAVDSADLTTVSYILLWSSDPDGHWDRGTVPSLKKYRRLLDLVEFDPWTSTESGSRTSDVPVSLDVKGPTHPLPVSGTGFSDSSPGVRKNTNEGPPKRREIEVQDTPRLDREPTSSVNRYTELHSPRFLRGAGWSDL